jgi:hypothetical protein
MLAIHHHKAQQAPLPTLPPPQPARTTRAQRLAQALGPAHRLTRFRTSRECPTAEHARWRIIELLAVGFRPRRVAKCSVSQPAVVYSWQRRFNALCREDQRTCQSRHADPLFIPCTLAGLVHSSFAETCLLGYLAPGCSYPVTGPRRRSSPKRGSFAIMYFLLL